MISWSIIISWAIGVATGAIAVFLNEGVKIYANKLFSGEFKKAKDEKKMNKLKPEIFRFVSETQELVTAEMIRDKFFKEKTKYEVSQILDEISIESNGRFILKDASTHDGYMEYWNYYGELD